MSHSEVHIFWWYCDAGSSCPSSAFVIGEGIPPGWWTLEHELLRLIGGSLGEREMVFCSEACATSGLGNLVSVSQRYRGDTALDASVLLDALQESRK